MSSRPRQALCKKDGAAKQYKRYRTPNHAVATSGVPIKLYSAGFKPSTRPEVLFGAAFMRENSLSKGTRANGLPSTKIRCDAAEACR